jgi:hypothetical protein
MTFTLTYAWWWIPTLVTVLGIGYMLVPKDYGGNFPDIGSLLDFVVVLIVVLLAWAVGGFIK